MSLQAQYASDVTTALAKATAAEAVTDADVARLPLPVQRYLRAAGVVGQPRVANFRVRMHGRIRRDAQSTWMPLRAEQYNVVEDRQRFFYLTSSLFGVPVRGYHRYVEAAACMDIRVAGVIPIVRTSGPEMFQSETVTVLNDMCLFAPATLIDPALVWEEADRRSARVGFTNRDVTVRAELTFNDAGELVDFASDDRYQASADGRQRRRRWSTPVIAYRTFGPMRLIASGEGRWHAAEGSFAYIELEIDEIDYNLGTPARIARAAKNAEDTTPTLSDPAGTSGRAPR